MNNLLKFEKSYTYKIEAAFLETNESCYVKGNINPEQFGKLVYYLNEKLRDMLDKASLTPIDIIEILERFYDFKIIDGKGKKADAIIELTELWEMYDEEYDDIVGNDIYYVNGIDEALQDIVCDIVYTNPAVFHEKFMELAIEKDGVSYIPVPSRILDEVKQAMENK